LTSGTIAPSRFRHIHQDAIGIGNKGLAQTAAPKVFLVFLSLPPTLSFPSADSGAAAASAARSSLTSCKLSTLKPK
jgi:hypothetical protein